MPPALVLTKDSCTTTTRELASSIDLLARHESSNGTACTAQSGCSPHVYRLPITASHDAHARSLSAHHAQNIFHRRDALPRTCHESIAMHARTASLSADLCHTSHTGCSPSSDAPDNIAPRTDSDSLDMHMASSVFLASLHLPP